jgi:type II secretory pathway component GspD/PulD (secretin)
MRSTRCIAIVFICYIFIHYLAGGVCAYPEDMETEIFSVSHRSGQDIFTAVKPMTSPKGKISYFPKGGKIIVQDMPGVLKNIRGIIEHLDEAVEQIRIKVLITELTESEAGRLGIGKGVSMFEGKGSEQIRYFLSREGRKLVKKSMSVLTMNNQAARVNMAVREITPDIVLPGEEISVVVPGSSREAGNFLEVLPRMHEDGTITVRVSATGGEFTGTRTGKESSIITRTRINDGGTIAIGGAGTSYERQIAGKTPFFETGISRKTAGNKITVIFLTVDTME